MALSKLESSKFQGRDLRVKKATSKARLEKRQNKRDAISAQKAEEKRQNEDNEMKEDAAARKKSKGMNRSGEDAEFIKHLSKISAASGK